MSVIRLTIIHSRLIRQIPVNTGCETVLLCGHKTAFEGPCRSAGVCEQPQQDQKKLNSPRASSYLRHPRLREIYVLQVAGEQERLLAPRCGESRRARPPRAGADLECPVRSGRIGNRFPRGPGEV